MILFLFYLGLNPLVLETLGSSEAPDTKNMVFTEELRFGNNPDDHRFLWPGPLVYLDVDHKEQFLVGDQSGNRVILYNSNGTFNREIAIKGEGPGELTGLSGLKILMNGNLIVFNLYNNNPSIELFDKDYQWVKKISALGPNFSVKSAQASPDSRFLAATFNYLDRKEVMTLTETTGILDLQLNIKKKQSAVSIILPGPRSSSAKYWENFFANIIKLSWSNKGIFAFSDSDKVFTANRGAYSITRLNRDLQKEMVYSRSIKPTFRSDVETDLFLESLMNLYLANVSAEFQAGINMRVMRKALEIAKPVNTKLPILGMIAMPKDGLLVVSDSNPEINTQSGDIFDKNGLYIARAELSDKAFMGDDDDMRMIFKNDKAYTVLSNVQGDNFIVKYRYGLE